MGNRARVKGLQPGGVTKALQAFGAMLNNALGLVRQNSTDRYLVTAHGSMQL
jgi:hypothetical protein